MVLEKLNNIYKWLFSEEERAPIGFIPAFFMNILLSTSITLFIIMVLISRLEIV